jgi:hypothetical protein
VKGVSVKASTVRNRAPLIRERRESLRSAGGDLVDVSHVVRSQEGCLVRGKIREVPFHHELGHRKLLPSTIDE